MREEHRAKWLVIVSINCPSRVKEITQLHSSEQTGTGGDELAVYTKKFYYCVIYYIIFIPVAL